MLLNQLLVFFFMQKTAYEMRISDWSSDVCSSDLSEPTLSGHVLPEEIDARYVYLMLHGLSEDARFFWGETMEADDSYGSLVPALSLSDIPSATNAIVFSGCCHGALITDTLAAEWDVPRQHQWHRFEVVI